jgi:hypothetical protein
VEMVKEAYNQYLEKKREINLYRILKKAQEGKIIEI